MTENNAGSEADPANLIGKTVKIVDLASRQDLNGHLGKVKGFKVDRQRYTVQLESISPAALAAAARAGQSAPQAQTFDFKAQNLVSATFMDQMMAKFTTMRSLFSAMIADPVLREQVRRTYTNLKAKLPPGVKPEYVGIALVMVMFLIVRMIGVFKFFMLFSLLGMIPAICMPDLAAGADAKTCMRNFPRRWREALVQATGFSRISEKVALIGLGIVVLLSFKILLTPTGTGNVASIGNRKPLSSVNSSWEATKASRELWREFENAEDIYQLGFEDAKAGKDYGASLPGDASEIKLSFGMSTEPSSTNYESDWDTYESMPTPPVKKSRFGVGTVFSLIALMRIVKELGFTPDNRPDPQLFMTNLKRMEPWRLGLLGFCVFNIISSIFF